MGHDMISRRRAMVLAGGTLAATTLVGRGALAAAGGMAEPTGSADQDIIGELTVYTAKYEDTLLDVARRFGLGFTELRAANRDVDIWLPGEGTQIILPSAHVLPDAPRRGLVLNLADQRMYFFGPDNAVITHPIGVGREGWTTPTGRTEIVRKAKNPSWYPPQSIREKQPELPKVVPPGPENPLGTRALYFDWPAYLMHGTNEPWGVGRRVSHGCVRLYNENVETLYEQVPIGTPVTIVDQEAKIGWRGNDLMMEVHPSQEQSDELELRGEFRHSVVSDLAERLVSATRDRTAEVDWDIIDDTVRAREGIPVAIGKAVEERTETAQRS